MRDTYANDCKILEKGDENSQVPIGLPLILSIEKSGNMKWYVDAVFAVHKDMRSHNGVLVTMETSRAYFQSIKKN